METGPYVEEDIPFNELVGWILFKYDLQEEGLADLLNVQPKTVYRWIQGVPPDFACAEILLTLLQYHGDDILPRLIHRIEQPTEEPWLERVRVVRERFGPSVNAFAEFLGVSRISVVKWERGAIPTSCFAVLIDLLYRWPGEMAALLEDVFPRVVEEEWDPVRLRHLATALRMNPFELSQLLQLDHSAVHKWFRGVQRPNACARVLLRLVEAFPERMVRWLQKIPETSIQDWPPQRFRLVREQAGITQTQLSNLTDIGLSVITAWESQGMTRGECPAVLYSLLEYWPTGTIKMLQELEQER